MDIEVSQKNPIKLENNIAKINDFFFLGLQQFYLTLYHGNSNFNLIRDTMDKRS